MRKTAFILFLILPLSLGAAVLDFEPSVSLGQGSYKYGNNTIIAPSIDILVPSYNNFDIGLGVSYLSYNLGKTEDLLSAFLNDTSTYESSNNTLNIFPLYVTGRYKYFLSSNQKLLFGLKLGVAYGTKSYVNNLKVIDKGTANEYTQQELAQVSTNFIYGASLGYSYSNFNIYAYYDILNVLNSYNGFLDTSARKRNNMISTVGLRLSYLFEYGN